MDHQSYKNWLLGDEHLTSSQERELRLHLQSCPECTSLARANRALRAAPMSTPAAGFALRFQERLAAERKAQRLRNTVGLTLIIIVGTGVAFLFAPTYLTFSSASPAQLTATAITNLMLAGVTLSAMANGNTFLAATFLPPYVWTLAFTLLIGAGFFWLVSSRRFIRFLQNRGENQSVTMGDQG